MIYLTEFDEATRQPLSPSQPLPCETLDDAAQLMGPPGRRYSAMLIYPGTPAHCVSRCKISIDGGVNKGETTHDFNQLGTNEK